MHILFSRLYLCIGPIYLLWHAIWHDCKTEYEYTNPSFLGEGMSHVDFKK